ncbi:uncharacterized protein LOC134262997 [Saccostrea cucullata]|uniref:uncharacterized protein LOC134262997 n=1 Tax=Saccostrea cuccullata TaxID=36930 RepID=UPI002ED48213
MQHLSETVFMGLSFIVGTSQQVIMRRELVDFRDMMVNQVIETTGDRMLTSGSRREGFRLQSSDMDGMFWRSDHTVIWNLDQVQNYYLSRKTLILCDCTESPPGYGLLELMTPTNMESVQNACMRVNDRLYISSSKYRQITCSVVIPNSMEHGPCGSGVIVGGGEYDTAQCFVSDCWPPPASKWVDRCHSWPPSYTVDDIVRNGCHFVAIGHKLGKHADKEWRISFSLAEQKLVYSMNHSQFLTYGLLKLFLKESINHGLRDEDKFLCSYHMKTAVLWMIQQNTLHHWFPQNLLECFWVCFKLILKWVYEGVCPNFFIPENNMFLSNIHGEAQKNLFIKLHELYARGIASVFYCPSIRFGVTTVLKKSISRIEQIMNTMSWFEDDLFHELSRNSIAASELYHCTRFFSAVEKLIILPLTQYQVLLLRMFTATVLQSTAFILYKFSTGFAPFKIKSSSVLNKQVYLANKEFSYMLKLASKFGCISDMLYLAMFYYKTLRYKKAISVIEMTNVKLAQPYIMYISDKDYNAGRCIFSESMRGQSRSTNIRHTVAKDFVLPSTMCYINELLPEQQSLSQYGQPVLFIPLYVLLHMLEVLCYRYVDPVRAQTALNDLQDLVHHDQRKYIRYYLRNISWQILGICQQVTGNHQAALYSYQQALKHISTSHDIQTATVMRIQQVRELICRDHH